MLIGLKKLIYGTATLAILTTMTACNTGKIEEANQPATAPTDTTQQTQPVAQSTTAPQTPLNEITIIFATRKDSKNLQDQANQVSEFLTKQMGIPVKAVIGDETAAVEGLRANKGQAAFIAGRASLKAEELSQAKMYLAEVRDDYSQGYTYNSVFVVAKDSPLQTQADAKSTLAQLQGQRMAFASKTSGSGYIFPLSELVGLGFVDGPDRLENFFSQVTYGDGYTSALQAVLRGQADVAAVSEYSLSEPWITADEAAQLRVLQAIPKVPAHGIVIDDSVPATQREQLITALLLLNEPAQNAIFQGLYNSQKLVKVNHAEHLASLRQALERAKIQP